MGGKASKDKGNRMERDCVNAFRAYGLTAERVPLSGAAGGSYCSDFTARVLGLLKRFEAKWRKDGFKQIYDWLGDNDGLVIRANHEPALMVITLEDYIRLVQIANRNNELDAAA